MQPDPRAEIYDNLHHEQMAQQESQNRASALIILQILMEYLRPTSVLDVGCGLGSWLSAAKELGIEDLHGIEGNWLDRAHLAVDANLVSTYDLENEFSLGRKFDLAICLEVAEHVSAQNAATVISSISNHADLVLFSAAIPFQGGHHHVNERFPDYWAALFRKHDFRPIDFIRPRIWADPSVLWWLKQNTLAFAHDRLLAANDRLRAEQQVSRPLVVVHPEYYMMRMRAVEKTVAEHQQFVQLIGQEGTFSVTRLPDGRMNLTRVR